MMALCCLCLPPCLPLPLTSFSLSLTVPYRGTTTLPVAILLLHSPPPCSLLPPMLMPVLVLEPPPVPPRRGCKMDSKISSIPSVCSLPSLPLFLSHAHSPSVLQSQ